jgi:hypothetical protein
MKTIFETEDNLFQIDREDNGNFSLVIQNKHDNDIWSADNLSPDQLRVLANRLLDEWVDTLEEE